MSLAVRLSKIFFIVFNSLIASESYKAIESLNVGKGNQIVIIGNNLCSRMMNFGYFETEIHLRHPKSKLTIRNMCDGGNTAGFRPHAGRLSHWAFPLAEDYNAEYSRNSDSEGHFETPDEWLKRLKADIIIAFFGYNESFRKEAGVELFKKELEAFIHHTRSQKYNGASPPQLAIVSPIAFEDLSNIHDLPNGEDENKYLYMYKEAMKKVSEKNGVVFIDVFNPSKIWFEEQDELTIDGFQLNDQGYKKLSQLMADKLFSKRNKNISKIENLIREAVLEKNWMWHNDFKIPNGVHVFGRRYDPYGPENYPSELTKIREMTVIRDKAIWSAIKGKRTNLAKKDKGTSPLAVVKTNYNRGDSYSNNKSGSMVEGNEKEQIVDVDSIYLSENKALSAFTLAPGYKVELFASEKEFPDLANPVQLSFDNKGRLWIATMPTYPHYRAGDERPNDKLIILEDTDKDGRADNQITFADGLHIPVGFEFSPEGVYVSQGTNLTLYSDTNDDDKFDKKQIVLSGFDDHDTHHNISAFCADPSGAIYMGEGVFLHSNIETAYGPVDANGGGFYRYSPQKRYLERTVQHDFLPNPWGIAFDRCGQNFYCDTSGPPIRWMMPATIKPLYGVGTKKPRNLVPKEHQVRPTSGLEFISSRHFPEQVQGDLLVNNTIGFLGTKQHAVLEDGTGYKFEFRQDLIVSEDGNFRPVDMEFAPDGSLYIVDWHNLLIGHMQHNARDPLRDHSHGRIYRITYPDRPLVKEALIAGASIGQLLDNLKLPEYRTRYRTRRELRARNVNDVLTAVQKWVKDLDAMEPNLNHHLLEALWVTWGLNKVDENLLKKLLSSKDHRVRAAAVRVLRYSNIQLDTKTKLMKTAAIDEHGRVHLEAITAASWLEKDRGLSILSEAKKMPLDDWMDYAHQASVAHINGRAVYEDKIEEKIITDLKGNDLALFQHGWKLYNKNGLCITCHQADGKGLIASGYPPLSDTDWVTGNEERLIKILLKGLYGPLEVNGKQYRGVMASYDKLLNDNDIASVLTYIRNSFGNQASVITKEKVAKIRLANKDRENYFTSEELLEGNINND